MVLSLHIMNHNRIILNTVCQPILGQNLIEEAGRELVERDTLFNLVERMEPLPVAVA